MKGETNRHSFPERKNQSHRTILSRIILFYLWFSLIHFYTYSQAGEWTWMKGSNLPNSTGSFGVMGTPSPTNTPPALYGAATWLDASNNIWLFGGVMYNTLWKYDITTNEWTWINGTTINSSPGVYGTMGVSSSTNTPGARGYGFLSWKDLNGDYWIYGGDGYDSFGNEGLLNDMWKYTVSTNEWTWMSGSNIAFPSAAPDYGTFQVPSPTNTPGGREETTVNWVDSAGNLWFFGGFDYNITQKDDIWMYDVTLNQWVWMAGSSGSNDPPVYGTLNVPSPTNTPGARNAYCWWKDVAGDLWMFGGSQILSQTADLWKFDMSTLEWTWTGGSQDLNSSGFNTGALCASDTSFIPASRSENRAHWVDKCGNFWLFGGVALLTGFGYDEDLWVYRYAEKDWTWAGGSLGTNLSANYGTQGVSSPTNLPGGRYGAPAIYDQNENVWIFGGKLTGNETGNDLWRFVPDTTCPALTSCALQAPSFAASDTDVCEKFCVDFTDLSGNNPTSWNWSFPGGTPSSSTDQNPIGICYQTPGTYDVILTTTSASGTQTTTFTNYITVYPTPPFPTITQNGYTLTSSSATSYQWQFNSVDIPGATNQSYDVQQSGYYTVFIKDQNGCSSSATVYMLIEGVGDIFSEANLSIYPNPSSGLITVELNKSIAGEVSIKVVNTLGQVVFSSVESLNNTSSNHKKEIDLTNVADGVYFIDIKMIDAFVRKKLVIAK